MATRRTKAARSRRQSREDAEGVAVATGVGLVVSILGNVLQAKAKDQMRERLEGLWQDRARLLAVLKDWQQAHARMTAELQFLEGQHGRLKSEAAEARRQRDGLLKDLQEARQEIEGLRKERDRLRERSEKQGNKR